MRWNRPATGWRTRSIAARRCAPRIPRWRPVLDEAAQNLMRSLDPHDGGFGGAPKFPQPMILDFLLQNWRRTGDEQLRKAVTFTLDKMARGGIYDQLGGGFHRYSIDARWLVPHFEKMLYDNAQLARTYLHAWQVTGDAELRQVVEETLDYVLREMTAPEGGFYSTQDADSEGEEGKFFVWTPDEMQALLGPEDGPLFGAYFGVTERGNFQRAGPALTSSTRRRPGGRRRELRSPRNGLARWSNAAAVLLEAREQRVHPGRDEKVLTEWNGLMIHALAEAARRWGERTTFKPRRGLRSFPDHMSESASQRISESANHEARQLRDRPSFAPSSLPHLQGRPRAPQRLPGGLRGGRVGPARALPGHVRAALAGGRRRPRADDPGRFRDADGGGFFQTSADHEKLVARRKDFVDSAVPAGNSLTADLFLRLALLGMTRRSTGATPRGSCADGRWHGRAAAGVRPAALRAGPYLVPARRSRSSGTGRGRNAGAAGRGLPPLLPNSVLALAAPGEAAARDPAAGDRGQIGGRATAYVCQNYVCNLPVTEPEALAAQLLT